jgi:hypothetical protein
MGGRKDMVMDHKDTSAITGADKSQDPFSAMVCSIAD